LSCKQEKIRKYRYFRISGDVLEEVNQGSVLVMCGEERGRAGEGGIIVFICIIVGGQKRFSEKSRMSGWFERIVSEDIRNLDFGCPKLYLSVTGGVWT
jgi:hypothetical protein